MPELPDVAVYVEALAARVVGRPLERVRIVGPALLRTYDLPVSAVEGERVSEVRRVGKRIALGFENGLWLVVHLMIAGRLHWKERGANVPSKRGLAAFDFPPGTLLLTEASPQKRATLHVVRGEEGVARLDAGGLEVLDATRDQFAAALRVENHTLKRALTDPWLFSGIGNAYSDEILHRARLSPVKWSRRLDDDEIDRLFAAARDVLVEWTERLREEAGGGFPEKVTAFRKGMAVHGRFGKPCPVCRTPVQRIRYADNETNYCPRCQTAGKLLADRSLSRLLKDDWPRTIDELEARR
ncbi:MAG: DNA-formamidopyrimidine glycosylase family protein [Planctomycetales bacterium]